MKFSWEQIIIKSGLILLISFIFLITLKLILFCFVRIKISNFLKFLSANFANLLPAEPYPIISIFFCSSI